MKFTATFGLDLKKGEKIEIKKNKTGFQFIQNYTENGKKITKRAGLDLNPNSSHVKKIGPHLNLQTQVNGNVVKGGKLADPHISIDKNTIRVGDY